MAITGMTSKYFLIFTVTLLVKISVVETQRFFETLGYPEKLSINDGNLDHVRHKRELTSSAQQYTVELEVNVSEEALLELLKSYLNAFINQTSTNISAVDITTVCQLNKAEYQCKCGAQYFWPCNKCVKYGLCDTITNSTCGCINAVPSDGEFCQPLNNLNSNSCPAPTGSTDTQIKLSLKINENFDITLTNPASKKYLQYKTDILKAIDDSYRIMAGYKSDSVVFFRFRPGSVIADFGINTTKDELNFTLANSQLSTQLTTNGYPVVKEAFDQSEEYDLLQSPGNIYPQQNMQLSCSLPVVAMGYIKWRVNGAEVLNTTKYQISGNNLTLTVKSVSAVDNGIYECITEKNSLPFIQWQRILIQPYPNIQAGLDKMFECMNFTIPLHCCAHSSYTIEWIQDSPTGMHALAGPGSGCIKYSYTVEKQDCDTGAKNMTFICQLSDVTLRSLSYGSKSITIATTKEKFTCSNSEFGIGRVNDKVFKQCEGDVVGIQQAQCDSTGDWKRIFSNCTLRVIQDLADQAKNLDVRDIPQFAANLSAAVIGNARNITTVNENLLKVVDLLSTIASVAKTLMINKEVMTDFLNTVDIIASQEAQETWKNLNKDGIDQNMCSVFLQSIETIGSSLSDENCNITTPNIQLKRTSFDHSFNALFLSNISTEVGIPATPNNITHLITLIVFSALNNVLPVRNATYNDSIQTGTSINGDVILINTEPKITNISLSYGVKNESLSNPQCVFWNFDLLNGIGAWDSTGCELKPIKNQTEYTCECNHTTSFSILMSPFFPDNDALAIISYIGVGISIISLILCLIIESIIWKSVTRNDMSYMRHISIVNIALSLLIADICFIIGASLVKKGEKTPVGPCSAVTFFIHFFYLALFFWMLLSALLLLHHIIMVFSRMSKARMMAIAFTVGYGAPLIIAVITVASTAGYEGYIHERNSCWLNWDKTKALLAFVVPALTIVVINLVVLLVVLNKIMRRGIGATTLPSEKHIIVVLARCVAILTPLFGLTWGFGIGTMVSSDFGIHVVFAFLNSLQGFFVLVFGTLMDHKIYEALAGKLRLRSISSNFTESTNAGPSSPTRRGYIHRFPKRYAYNISSNAYSSPEPSSSLQSFRFLGTQ